MIVNDVLDIKEEGLGFVLVRNSDRVSNKVTKLCIFWNTSPVPFGNGTKADAYIKIPYKNA